jgi:hypothetical protein
VASSAVRAARGRNNLAADRAGFAEEVEQLNGHIILFLNFVIAFDCARHIFTASTEKPSNSCWR